MVEIIHSHVSLYHFVGRLLKWVLVNGFAGPVERRERTFYLNERIINMCERLSVSFLCTDQCVVCQITDSHYCGIYICCVSITGRGFGKKFLVIGGFFLLHILGLRDGGICGILVPHLEL